MIKAIVGKVASGKSTKLLEEELDVLFHVEGSKKLRESGAIQIPLDAEDCLSLIFEHLKAIFLSKPLESQKYIVGIDSIDLFRHPLKTTFKRLRKFQSVQKHQGLEVGFIVTYQMSRKGYIFAEGADIIEVVVEKHKF